MAYIGQTPTAIPLDGDDLSDDIITLAKMASGTDGNIITYDASGNPAAVATGSSGQVLTSAGAGAPPTFSAAPSHTGNVAFPATQSASGDANTLDDYEEGTFSPVLGGSGGQSGQSYSTQLGVYTKIGRIVHCSGYINLGTKGTITATLQLSGLPFTAGTGAGFNSAASLITINAWTIAAGTYVQFGINNASATANFRSYLGTGASANGANMATANVNNGTHVSFNITYAV